MPLDPNIPFMALRGGVAPLDISQALADRDRQRAAQAVSQEAQRKAAQQQHLAQIASQYGDDPEAYAVALDKISPADAQEFRKKVSDTHTAVAEAYLKEGEAKRAKYADVISKFQGADESNWPQVTADAIKQYPELTPVLAGKPYDPELVNRLVMTTLDQDQWVQAKLRASESLQKNDARGFVTETWAAADTPQKQAEAQKVYGMLGLTPIARLYPTPQDAQAAIDAKVKASPDHAAKVGTFEDYVVRTYGANPTSAQILAARKAYGQADDRPRVAVTVAGGGGQGTIGGLTTGEGGGLEYAATVYRLTQKMPVGLARGGGGPAVVNEAAKQTRLLGQKPVTNIQRSASLSADSKSLAKITAMQDAAGAYENKAQAQLDIVDSLSDKVSRTSIPLINRAIIAGQTEIAGDPDATLLLNAVLTATTEYAKIMSGGTGSAAATTDSAQKEAGKLLNAAMSPATLRKATALMRQEMGLTMQGYQATIEHINERMGGQPAPTNAKDPMGIR